MLIKLENPALMSKAIELISELVTEVRIKVDEDGLTISAIDPANVAMVDFRIPKNSFSGFETDKEVLGVNLDNLKQILRRCSSGSSLIMEKKGNLLNIQIHDRIKRNFNLALIDIETDDKEMPELEYSSKIEINSIDLIASIEDCAVVADACSFIIEERKFIIEAKGLNSARSEFSGDEAKIEGEPCKAKYSIEYLTKFIKGAKLCEKIILKFAEDHPLRMNIMTDFMKLSFLLAPRVETED